MERHRERMGITLLGGLPWGFSIKGGSENNWSITISKLERNGKGEASGLRIGDIITCVNDVTVGGNRREAVELIRKSGQRLVLEVERDFPSNTFDAPTQERPTPLNSYNSDARRPLPSDSRGISNQTGWYNNTYEQTINFSYNEPAGYNFSETTTGNKISQQQVKEKLKAVIAEKRDGLVKTLIDASKERQVGKGRRSMTSASTVSEPSESIPTPPSRIGVRHRHGNKDAERPRSWHASKHPEIDQELRSMALSPTDKDQPPQQSNRRKSKGWLESEDLRCTLDRNSAESLSARSSEHLLTENGETILPSHRRNAQNRSRDRSSINSNPSLMEAVQASLGSHNSSLDCDYPHPKLDRSSQDSLNSSSVSVKSSKADVHSSGSKNNVYIEGSVGNKLRSSGRYGVVWKLPQVHRRARSFDALSEDSPPQGGESNEIGRKSTSSTHSESSSHRTEVTHKSPSPVKSGSEFREDFQFPQRGEKERRKVDALISNFERSAPSDKVSELKCVERKDARSSNVSGGIIKHLQNWHSSSLSNVTAKPHNNVGEKGPTSGPARYHVQSPKDSGLSLFIERDADCTTLQSRSDEYKKNIQGMSKKVLRVTSFTRKDLEFSPPHPSPVHQPKVFCFPVPITEGRETSTISTNGNVPVRSKSTSSLLENSVVVIPITREEPNFLHGKQYCESLPASSVSPTTAADNSKELISQLDNRIENAGGHAIKRERGSRNNGLTKLPEVHCEKSSIESPTPPLVSSHKSIILKDVPPAQEFSRTHDLPTTPRTSIKTPNVPLVLTTEVVPIPLIEPYFPIATLPTDIQPTDILSSALTSAASTSSTVTSFSEPLSSSSPLPATSAYYQTSASKAKIIHLVQERVEGGEIIDLENSESEDERNKKKVELLKSLRKKLSDLQKMKDLLKAEINENEQLGRTVKQSAEKLCTPREHERFKTFVEEIDKIFNLLFSISGRLARVENTLATLDESADQEEKHGLLEKKRRLTSQHQEAISLKENEDKRQVAVSKILASHMNKEQFSDFEHYIKMKTTLISEQRDVDDKIKLGEEQMRELYESLPESFQEEQSPYLQYQAPVPPSSCFGDEKPDNDLSLS